MKVLEGVLVVDLGRVLAGPFCAQLLADMGAQVIKVESPGGDENRLWQPIMPNGQSSNFASVNRGKRSLTLNLKAELAPEVLRRLTERADVMLHNFLPATAERLGLRYETLREINPGLVYCTISGYGEHGPLRNKPGYDLMVQAFSGTMSTIGFEDGPPVRSGVSFIDMATGLSAYGAIVSALLARERTGRGTCVRASLLETAVALLGYHAVAWLQAGVLPKRQGSGSASSVPYQAFKCQDGYLLAGAPSDPAWRRFCEAIGLAELAEDERFHNIERRVANRELLVPILDERFAQKTVSYWLERLEAKGVAVAPLHTLDQVLTHPQVLANAMVAHAGDADGAALPLLGMPFKLGERTETAPTAAPRLGAHTDEILRDVLDFSAAEIDRLHSAGAV